MPVTVVVGGQYGSEGKGKVAHYVAKTTGAKVAVRVGGPNSGHTVVDQDGNTRVFRLLPTPSLLPGVTCVLPAGSYIDPDLLLREVEFAGLTDERLVVDPGAMILTDHDQAEEQARSLRAAIGSTQSGTGAAVQRRIARDGTATLAADDERLRPFLRPAVTFMRSRLQSGERIVIEGTQGFGLSVLHSPHYPYATSRDTTAAGAVSETGLSPLDVDDVVLVLRAHPIRVAGNSGPLPGETSWADVSAGSGKTEPIEERTTVTKLIRRVGRFEPDIVRAAIEVNSPTCIVLNHVDYVDDACRILNRLSSRAGQFVRGVEAALGRPIDLLGFGPASLETCPQRAARSLRA